MSGEDRPLPSALARCVSCEMATSWLASLVAHWSRADPSCALRWCPVHESPQMPDLVASSATTFVLSFTLVRPGSVRRRRPCVRGACCGSRRGRGAAPPPPPPRTRSEGGCRACWRGRRERWMRDDVTPPPRSHQPNVARLPGFKCFVPIEPPTPMLGDGSPSKQAAPRVHVPVRSGTPIPAADSCWLAACASIWTAHRLACNVSASPLLTACSGATKGRWPPARACRWWSRCSSKGAVLYEKRDRRGANSKAASATSCRMCSRAARSVKVALLGRAWCCHSSLLVLSMCSHGLCLELGWTVFDARLAQARSRTGSLVDCVPPQQNRRRTVQCTSIEIVLHVVQPLHCSVKRVARRTLLASSRSNF